VLHCEGYHLWWFLAWQGRQIVAIVHLIDILHIDTAAGLRGITFTGRVALAISAFVCVVEEWRAIALRATLQAKELHTCHIGTEIEAYLRGHWHPVLLWNLVMVPNLLFCLCVHATDHMQVAARAPFLGDSVFPVETRQRTFRKANQAGRMVRRCLQTIACREARYTMRADV
jgi:hypothetical protein